MPRRFQFSLRALLALAGVVCLLFGGWQMLVRYGQIVELMPAVAHEPIRIKGRFFLFSVAPTQPYSVLVVREGGEVFEAQGHASRWVPFVYQFDEETTFQFQPGQYHFKGAPSRRPLPAVTDTLLVPDNR
ncbi:MAG: hypothetical protein ACREHD_10970 [Pirellulales bacterium]